MGTKNSVPKTRVIFRQDAKTEKEVIEELEPHMVQMESEKDASCDECLRTVLTSPIAVSMCFICELYLCEGCSHEHNVNEQHRCFTLGRKSELDTCLFQTLMNETGRRDRIKTACVSLHVGARINLNYLSTDKLPNTYKVRGMDNNMLIVYDKIDNCIKIINLRTHLIERSIRVAMSAWPPNDFALMDIELGYTDSTSESEAVPNMSILHNTEPSKNRALAVTFPEKRQIVIIDINKKPALKIKAIQCDKYCYGIESVDGTLYVLCNKQNIQMTPSSSWYIYIISSDGNTLKTFQITTRVYFNPFGFMGLVDVMPRIAVLPGQILFTDPFKSKVQCLDIQRRLISSRDFNGERVTGITVDPDSNIYVCAGSKIYKLSTDLKQCTLLIDMALLTRYSNTACFYRDTLYVWHYLRDSRKSTISAFRLV